jgi:hypothetical protein
MTALSTGLFGGAIQTFTAWREKGEAKEAAYSPVNSRDIAITAISNNLHHPQLQAALSEARRRDSAPEIDPSLVESTRFRDKIDAERGLYSPSLAEKLNRKLAESGSPSRTSHTDRVKEQRDAAANSERLH